MFRSLVRPAAILAVPALVLVGAATAHAAGLTRAAPLERTIAASDAGTVIRTGEGNQHIRERRMARQQLYGGNRRGGTWHRRRHHSHRGYHNGVFFGFYPFILNDYPPYYRYHRRSYGGTCGYWSRRCAARWGYGNSNYYGCMRYEGC